jgi:hypothetical protein
MAWRPIQGPAGGPLPRWRVGPTCSLSVFYPFSLHMCQHLKPGILQITSTDHRYRKASPASKKIKLHLWLGAEKVSSLPGTLEAVGIWCQGRRPKGMDWAEGADKRCVPVRLDQVMKDHWQTLGRQLGMCPRRAPCCCVQRPWGTWVVSSLSCLNFSPHTGHTFLWPVQRSLLESMTISW